MERQAEGSTTPTGTSRNSSSDPVPNLRISGGSHHFPGGNPIKFFGKLRISSWNVGSLNGRTTELASIMRKRGIDIMALQETKWKGAKAKQLTEGYKLLYYGKNTKQNGVGIILAPHLASKIIVVNRVSDRLIMVKLAIEKLGAWNFISAYAPQTGCTTSEKSEFLEDLENLLETIPPDEEKFILADMNAHIGETNEDFEGVHGGFGFGSRNREGRELLEFASTHNLVFVNTFFSKQTRHLITYNSGIRSSQIDYILCDANMRRNFSDCKVILGEAVVSQHRLLIGELKLPVTLNRKDNSVVTPKIKWHRLRDPSADIFINDLQNELIESSNNSQCLTSNQMWVNFEKSCVEKAKAALGVSKGKFRDERETWWWNELVQKAVSEKKVCFKSWKFSLQDPDKTDEERQQLRKNYKDAKKRSKIAVAKSRDEASQAFYQKLETSEGQNNIYRIASQRERKSKDIRNAKYIRDEQGVLLTNDTAIRERWKSYCSQLLNEEFERSNLVTQCPVEGPVLPITPEEVKLAVLRMKNGKAIGPDEIPAEFWKRVDHIGFKWLSILFDKILDGESMPESFRDSFLVPFFKNKGDASLCENYRSIKLLPHTFKIFERILDARIKDIADIHGSQCGFVSGKSCADAIQTLRIVIEKCRDNRQDLHMVFIDLEKAFDRVPRDIVYASLRWHGVPERLVKVVMDMYAQNRTRIRSTAGISDEFTVNVGVSQGSALSPLLFILVINYLTVDLMEELPWSLIFADDIALAAHSMQDLEDVLEKWRKALEDNGLKISRKKTEYMSFHFSTHDVMRPQNTVRLDGEPLTLVDSFKYLGSMITNDGKCDKDVQHRIQAGWLKWRSLSGVLCDKKIPIKLKGKVYNTIIKPVLLYGSECWTRLSTHTQKMNVTETRMLRWSGGVTLFDRVRNKHLLGSFGVKEPMNAKLDERQIRWYGHLLRRPEEHITRKAMSIPETMTRGRGRPRETWMRNVQRRMRDANLSETGAPNRREWNLRSRAINIANPS